MPSFFDDPTDRGYIKSFDGLKIYWERYGAEPTPEVVPILFFYGLACSKYQWKNVVEFFVNERPCIFMDYRGHHRSEYIPTDPKLTAGHLAKDAAAVLDELKIPHAHIFAHSMGCNVAIELAFNQPERICSMILVAGSAQNPFKKMLGLNFMDRMVTPLLGMFPSHKEHFFVFWRWLMKNRAFLRLVVQTAGFNRKAVESSDVDTYLDAVATVSPRVFFELLHEMSLGGTRSLLGRIRCPVLVVSGANDQVTPTAQQKKLADGIQNAEYFSVPLGSHNVQLEFADYLSRKIREFWSQRLPKPSIKKKRETKSERN